MKHGKEKSLPCFYIIATKMIKTSKYDKMDIRGVL